MTVVAAAMSITTARHVTVCKSGADLTSVTSIVGGIGTRGVVVATGSVGLTKAFEDK